jgi:TRAP-type C4-dicarboxylate transport system substrate-binding protein
MHPKNAVVVNQRGYARLPKDQQGALTKAAAAAEKRGWEMSRAREKEGDQTLAKNGMSVREPDAAMKAAFQKVGNQMAQEWEKSAGADGQAILKRFRGSK